MAKISARCLLGVVYYCEDGATNFLRNIGKLVQTTLPREPQIWLPQYNPHTDLHKRGAPVLS
jgi:hypothetical protein